MGMKYRNKICMYQGVKFHSQREMGRYIDLSIMMKAGKISNLVLQPVFKIEICGVVVGKAIMDFQYIYNGETIVEDVKGFDTALSKFKRKCVEAQYKIKVRVIK